MSDDHRGFIDRVHFLAVASRVVPQVLVDYARARGAKKRAADAQGKMKSIEWTATIEVRADDDIHQVELLDLLSMPSVAQTSRWLD